jgi:hypothetical protein
MVEPILIIEQEPVLRKAFKHITEQNSSNRGPYHHLNHMMRVMGYANLGAQYHKITGRKRLNLLVACIFHDYNHSLGLYADSYNVAYAIKGVKSWYKFNEDIQSEIDIDEVVEIISATEYPYVIPSEELTLSQMIIRDSDLMTILDPDWINCNILGLMTEMKKPDLKEFVQGTIEFHKNAKMNSEWGQMVYKGCWPGVFGKLKALKNIIE